MKSLFFIFLLLGAFLSQAQLSPLKMIKTVRAIKRDTSLTKEEKKSRLYSLYRHPQVEKRLTPLSNSEKLDAIRKIVETNDSSKNETSFEKEQAIRNILFWKVNYLDWSDSAYRQRLSTEKISLTRSILDAPTSDDPRLSDVKVSDIENVVRMRHIEEVISESRGKAHSVRWAIYNKNALKFDVVRALTYGEFSLYYERFIEKRLSIELGGGPSISHFCNFIRHKAFGIVNPGSIIGGDLGVTAHAGLRAYLDKRKMGISGFYIGPELRYRYDGLKKTNLHSSIGSLSFNIGYQIWSKKHFGVDFYIGPGLSYARGQFQYETEKFPPPDIESGYYISFYLNVGLKFCVGW